MQIKSITNRMMFCKIELEFRHLIRRVILTTGTWRLLERLRKSSQRHKTKNKLRKNLLIKYNAKNKFLCERAEAQHLIWKFRYKVSLTETNKNKWKMKQMMKLLPDIAYKTTQTCSEEFLPDQTISMEETDSIDCPQTGLTLVSMEKQRVRRS